MSDVADVISKLLKNQRFRIIAAISIGTIALIIICSTLITRLSSTGATDYDIVIKPYAEEEIDGLDASGVFCKSILSTQVNKDITDGQAVVLKTNRAYQSYLDKYDDIQVLEPEQVPIVDDWFAEGCYAIVFSTEVYDLPTNLAAYAKYTTEEGTLKLLIGQSEIDPAFVYSQPVETCKQASVAIFLDKDLLMSTTHIEFLLQE